MKKLAYLIFAIIYKICCIFPREKNKVFAIMTHDASEGSNVGVVVKALQQTGEYHIQCLKKTERDQVTKQGKIAGLLHFFFCNPYHLATCSYILQDNVFLPMAYMKFPKSVKVVQLWHGTGTIKRFGQSVNAGELGKHEKMADETITHLIINGKATRDIYKEAFGVDDSRVYELGLPRTDLLFNQANCDKLKEEFYLRYPELKEKRLVLYAPTFRDDEVNHPTLPFDLNTLIENLPENMCIGFKLHPFVANQFRFDQHSEKLKQRVYNLSFEQDTNQLLLVADVLVTDYSSIVFEYCILGKPVLFYAYDYKDFKDEDRGFYVDYEEFVPGEIVYSQEELAKKLAEDDYDLTKLRAFVKEQYRYTDGQSTKRLLQTVFHEK